MAYPSSPADSPNDIRFEQYKDERDMPGIVSLIDKDLSEPYSVFTYRYFINNWPDLCYMTMQGDRCVGAIICKLDTHRCRRTHRGYIAMLAVEKELRGQRIGSKLVKLCLDRMRQLGADECVLETEVTNLGALGLYRSMGFVKEKRLHKYYLNGNDAFRLKFLFKMPDDLCLLCGDKVGNLRSWHTNCFVLVCGSLNADIIIEINRFPKKGETLGTRSADTGVMVPGGKGANQAVAASRLAAGTPRKAQFVCQFGNDSHATKLEQVLVDNGLDLSGCGRPQKPSGQAFIFLEADGSNSILIVGGSNVAWPAEVADFQRLIEGASAVLLQQEIPKYVNEAVASVAHAAGVPVIQDVGGEERDFPDEHLKKLDYICPNETELERLTGMATDSEAKVVAAARSLQKRGVKNVLCTLAMPQDSLDNQMANKQGSKGVEDFASAHGQTSWHGDEDEPTTQALDEDDVIIMRTYGVGPYVGPIKIAEKEAKEYISKINKLIGVKELLVCDKQMMNQEQALQVARVTKIIDPGTDDTKYVIKIREFAKFVVGLGEKVSATDIEESMRVGVDTSHGGKYRIQIPLPPKIDPSVTMMTVEDKPDVTYNDVGGAKEQLERLREVVEMPLLQPERFVALGIDPPKGVLLYGPPGTGKTLTARAVANRTDACFICVIGSELVQRYVGEGARMVRELFQLARTSHAKVWIDGHHCAWPTKKACILFIDEVDAIGGSRGGDEGNSDSEVQRTMLEIVNQLDGFDSRGNVKVLMATNRPDTLDPALLRPGRLDRKIEFGLPDLEGRDRAFHVVHLRTMAIDRDVRFELLARLCPNTTGAECRSVCTEAGMYAIRARRKSISEPQAATGPACLRHVRCATLSGKLPEAEEKDLIDAINKVIKGYSKFSATPKYMVYN
eukprot:s2319_g6.t1